jgi:hypothetical protein
MEAMSPAGVVALVVAGIVCGSVQVLVIAALEKLKGLTGWSRVYTIGRVRLALARLPADLARGSRRGTLSRDGMTFRVGSLLLLAWIRSPRKGAL